MSTSAHVSHDAPSADSSASAIGDRFLFRAVALYLVWCAATYLLEGRPRALLRPEAALLRGTYAFVANILIGTLAGLATFRAALPDRGRAAPDAQLGLASARRTALSVLAGFALGLTAYVLQGAPSLAPVVMLNGFAQVLVVSTAEVLVCWLVLGGAVLRRMNGQRGLGPSVVLVVSSGVMFGLYHFAHSPPFDQWGMVALLTGVGLATGVFFLVSRDLYGTIVFHNFLALFGVLEAVRRTIGLAAYSRLQWPLLSTALLAAVVLVVCDVAWVRPRIRAATGLLPTASPTKA